MKTKIRKRVKPSDLKPQDLDLLHKANYLDEDSFLCFGHSYYRLRQLDLINGDCKITYYGKQLVRYMSV